MNPKNAVLILLSVVLLPLSLTRLVAQWSRVNTGLPSNTGILSIASFDSGIIIGTYGKGVLRSTDGGLNWASSNSGLTDTLVTSSIVSGRKAFVGTEGDPVSGGRVFLSTNDGASWTAAGSGIGPNWVEALGAKDSFIFAGTYGNGVYRSSNNGASWSPLNAGLQGLPSWFFIARTFLTAGDTLYMGGGIDGKAGVGGIYRLTKNDTSWTLLNNGLSDSAVYALTKIGSNLFAATGKWGTIKGSVFRSTNGGSDWTKSDAGLPDSLVRALVTTGTQLFAGTDQHGIYLSTDYGNSWISRNSGLPTGISALSFLVRGSSLFAGTTDGLWVNNSIITDVNDYSQNHPEGFFLENNYPNPFNPSTTIRYHVPTTTLVVMKVYDVLGREVQTLVNEIEYEGDHSAVFNAKRQSSGLYFYRLEAGAYSATKKLVLLK